MDNFEFEQGIDRENSYYRVIKLGDYPAESGWVKKVTELKAGIGSKVVDLSNEEKSQLGFSEDISMSVYGIGKKGSAENDRWLIYFKDPEYFDPEGNKDRPFMTVSANRDGQPIHVYVGASQSIARYLLDKYGGSSFIDFVRSYVVDKNSGFKYDPNKAKFELTKRSSIKSQLDQIIPESTRRRDQKNPTPDEETTRVAQNKFSLAGPGLGKRYIETVGAGPCVAVSVYDPDTHRAAMAHFQAESDVATALRDMSTRVGGKKLEIRIVGGQTHDSKLLVASILKEVNKYGEVVEKDILGGGDKSRSVVLDTINGELYDLVNPKPKTDQLSMQIDSLAALSDRSNVKFQNP